MKFKPGDIVRTTKGDRFNGRGQFMPLEVLHEGGGWRHYKTVVCRKPGGAVSSFLEKNLVLLRAEENSNG